MRLVTLGSLSLAGTDFKRVKPLQLVAYLSLEGPQPRRYIAELFWPGASNNLNSLSVAMSQIRRGAPEAIDSDEAHLWTGVDCDAAALRDALRAGDVEGALGLYSGPFLHGAEAGLGEELEEWLFSTRERLANQLRQALLTAAEEQAATGSFDAAMRLAERAWDLPGAPEPEPEELIRFHPLLAAGNSPLEAEVRREAREYDLHLQADGVGARNLLKRSLLGRERELATMQEARPGTWTWLQGAPGMGKTTLLKQMSGTYLPARAGLPYATLEPLLADAATTEPAYLRNLLMAQTGAWLLDDWERIDDASRDLLTALRDVHVRATVFVASGEAPPFPVDQVLNVGLLPREAVASLEQGWERTGGLPGLVSAVMNAEPLEAALDKRLRVLDEETASVYYALVLLDEPDPALVRRALELPAATTATALEQLVSSGLIEPSGVPRARATALHALERQPAVRAGLALRLARALPVEKSHGLWQQARTLWEESDHPTVSASYLAWAGEVVRRGFPALAASILRDAPASQEVAVARAQALERAGNFRDALDLLDAQPDSAAVQAVRGAVLWRLGRPNEARPAAERALQGSVETRAWGHNTLGLLDFSQGNFRDAAASFRRAAALWHAQGDPVRRADALNNLGVVTSELGEDSSSAFSEAIAAAGENPVVLARIHLNQGRIRERSGNVAQALASLEKSAELAGLAGDIATAARARNNVGALRHRQGLADEARSAYIQALDLAQQAGEQRLLAVTLANLAELDEDFDAWQEAVRLFEQSGNDAAELVGELPADHPFRLRSGLAP